MSLLVTVEHNIALEAIVSCVADDLVQVDQAIAKQLHSQIPLIQQISEHIIHSGGKRIRPLVVLLSARALGCSAQNPIELAAIIELLHTATLLHDDVVDNSQLRRGKPTANALWDNTASILVGDFLYSRLFQMITNLANHEVMRLLADTTNQLAEGEMRQLLHRQDPTISEEQYLMIIQHKTAELFAAAAQLGAIISHYPTTTLKNYGLHLGLAFQMVDDLLDYQGNPQQTGKPIGEDLAEGKITLPLLYALQQSDNKQRAILTKAITQATSTNFPQIASIIHSTGALNYVRNKALQQARLAKACLATLPLSDYRTALENLADFTVLRCH